MRILVTGGAGYIGSHTIIELLMSADFDVVSVDNFSNSDPNVFERIHQITGKEVKNYALDLRDYDALKSELFNCESRFDAIIHFAALKAVGESVDKPILYYNNNLNALMNLLKCAHKYGIRNFLFSSSCTVYGNAAKQPVSEKTPLQQTESPYGSTKLVGEMILKDFSATEAGFRGVALRYFNPVGAHRSGLNGEWPRGRPNNLVPVITQFASGLIDNFEVFGTDYDTPDGTAIRDYIHVTDIARAHVRAVKVMAENGIEKPFDVFNLGNGRGVTVLEVIQAFEQVSGVKLNYKLSGRRAGDVERIFANADKARKILGWEPEYSILEAMASAWKWQQYLNDIKRGDTVPHAVS